jgi:hypothetical protein
MTCKNAIQILFDYLNDFHLTGLVAFFAWILTTFVIGG